MPAATATTTATLPRTRPTRPPGPPVRGLASAVVVAVAGAGAVHLAVGLDHGMVGHGPLLLAAGAAQLGVAASLARRLTRPRLWAAAALGVLVTASWAFTRLGGDQPVGLLDSATTVTQVGGVAASALLARRTGRRGFRPYRPLAALAAGALIGIAAARFVADDHGHHDHHAPAHAGPAASQPPIFGDLFAPHGGHEAPSG